MTHPQLKTTADLAERLSNLHVQTRETPLYNPVFQLGLDLSRAIEAGDLNLSEIESMVAELECDSMQSRASRLRRLVAPVSPEQNQTALAESLTSTGFDAFKTTWETPQLHAVFTAHPTFLLTPEQSQAVAHSASHAGDIGAEVCITGDQRPQVTLKYEHGRAMRAIAHAQDARDKIVGELLSHAATTWPSEWHDLAPLPFRFASWVGYDMDGRTDIKWFDSIGFRLREKAERLGRYTASLEAIDAQHKLLDTLRPAHTYAQARADDFSEDLSAPEALSKAANRLTQDDPDKLLSLTPLIDALESEAADAETGSAVQLKTLAAAMRADGLGMSWIHFRVNSSQLHNAIRRRIDPDNTLDLGSRGAMAALRTILSEVTPLKTNFAALAIESSTAIRQFLAMAQILHHIDADAPIRMLIAECEQPSTILAALYFARLFGIEDKVDVSPLFETESALEHGGRFLDALCAEETYQEYVRKRGRVAIQTGIFRRRTLCGSNPRQPRD